MRGVKFLDGSGETYEKASHRGRQRLKKSLINNVIIVWHTKSQFCFDFIKFVALL